MKVRLQDPVQMMNRNALHALMGLQATPIKAGGFKYIHRDTGLIFEIGPATPDSAGNPLSCLKIWLHGNQAAFLEAEAMISSLPKIHPSTCLFLRMLLQVALAVYQSCSCSDYSDIHSCAVVIAVIMKWTLSVS